MVMDDTIIQEAKELLRQRNKPAIKQPDHIGVDISKPSTLAVADWDGFTTPPHIQAIEEHLLAVANGDIKKLGIYMPPRHGKSEMVSVYFIAWYIINNPDKRVIFVTYSHEFAAEFGLRVRDVVSEFGEPYGIKVRDDMRQKNKFMIDGHRGSCSFTGIGGSITGKGADLLIIDDPVKDAETAMSDAIREKHKHWYRTTANTRLEPGAAQIIIQTRWHEDDISGWLQGEQPGQWTILSLPAIAEEDDQLGRQEGEALWPDRYPIEELKRVKEEAGSFWFSAMYQQDPQPAEGGMFKRDWIRTVKPLRIGHQGDCQTNGVMAVDLAIGGKKENDRTCIATVTPVTNMPGVLYVRNLRYGRWKHQENINNFLSEYQMMQPDSAYAEGTAYQDSFRQDIVEHHGLPLMKLDNRGGKEQRIIQTLQPMFESGKILFPENAPWIDDFMKEYLSFPNSKHDDLMDALEMAVRKAKNSMSPFAKAASHGYYEKTITRGLASVEDKPGPAKRRRSQNPYSINRS